MVFAGCVISASTPPPHPPGTYCIAVALKTHLIWNPKINFFKAVYYWLCGNIGPLHVPVNSRYCLVCEAIPHLGTLSLIQGASCRQLWPLSFWAFRICSDPMRVQTYWILKGACRIRTIDDRDHPLISNQLEFWALGARLFLFPPLQSFLMSQFLSSSSMLLAHTFLLSTENNSLLACQLLPERYQPIRLGQLRLAKRRRKVPRQLIWCAHER